MHNERESTAASSGQVLSTMLGAVLAGAGAVMTAWTGYAALPSALHGRGETGMLSWLVVALAAASLVLCAYLALIWALAATVLLAPPASRTGSAMLATLRILAPRLAHRLTLGAAVATATTGLVLAPALAATAGGDGEPPASRPVAAAVRHGSAPPASTGGSSDRPPAAAVLRSPDRGGPAADTTGADSSHSAPTPSADIGAAGLTTAPAESSASDGPSSTAEDGEGPADDPPEPRGSGAGSDPAPPPLGWGGASPESADSPPTAGSSGGPSSDDDRAPSRQMPGTVTVRAGDSLWTITDALLGPEPQGDSTIAAAWPLLHEANRELIGADPDRIEPGQVLVVPTSLSHQEPS